MKIAIIGFGKMGRAIAEISGKRGHSVMTFDIGDSLDKMVAERPDVAIEFTGPEAAPQNIRFCLNEHIPVVCGSTGWLSGLNEIQKLCKEKNGTFFYASNFSLGVNLFFKLNEYLAKLMEGQGYTTSIHEIHHTQKKDAPSGTAITLAEGILKNNKDLEKWSTENNSTRSINITSERKDPYPGTHHVKYTGQVDEIEIIHNARSREGFAAGAVAVAEWLPGKKGILTMQDFLRIG